jgi:hypothetical protein
MQDSRIIEINGVFVAAAVALPGAQGWRIVAANDRVRRVHGAITTTLNEARRLARQAYFATHALPAVA